MSCKIKRQNTYFSIFELALSKRANISRLKWRSEKYINYIHILHNVKLTNTSNDYCTSLDKYIKYKNANDLQVCEYDGRNND